MSKHQNTVIVIAGTTASGKTALAVKLAQKLNTVIISADSRQCFRELNIGVAKPSQEELNAVKHYFIDSHSIHENVTAQVFEKYAMKITEKVFEKNKYIVVAGGTGLYIKAFCEGMDIIPAIDNAIRQEVINNYSAYGLDWLQMQIQKTDPLFWSVAEKQNPQRLMRALEVKLATGKSIVDFRTGSKRNRPFNIIKFGIDISKESLNRNIEIRTDKMMQNGLLAEVEALKDYRRLNALRTVGYTELFEYADGNVTYENAVNNIKKNTRQYAKRQMTWFKKDTNINWKTSAELSLNFDKYF